MAILWHELWHEGLEEASRLYFTERNPEGMVAVLEPLHDMIEAVRGTPPRTWILVKCFNDRDPPPPVRSPSFKRTVGTCTRLGRLVVRTQRMARLRCLTGPGIFITVCVGVELNGRSLIAPMFTGLQEDREAAPTADNSGLAICLARSTESS